MVERTVVVGAALAAAGATCATIGITSLAPAAAAWLLGPQDLRAKYGAEWALVTGGASGIGLALVRKCASQRVSCVVVDRLPEPAALLEKLRGEFPAVQVRPLLNNLC
eukprot:TRINITY_DN4050_c0_g1_i1.p2 TRINITY_DN4050_c0_g1~~TRINITY_DN4050_c0_g1_i1.p2  ORF type:complete len:108 (-),score=23.48 TRINITY_DN4050_c0_g1_i1:172-495(-)